MEGQGKSETGTRPVKKPVWERYRKQATEARNSDTLLELLDHHLRIYHGLPSENGFPCESDTGEQRTDIIRFIIERLENEFAMTDLRPSLRYELPEQEHSTAMGGMGMM